MEEDQKVSTSLDRVCRPSQIEKGQWSNKVLYGPTDKFRTDSLGMPVFLEFGWAK
jgi:hypothetical protein